MDHKILVAMDDSENSMRAVRFVVKMFAPQHHITLLSVVPDVDVLCGFDGSTLSPYIRANYPSFCSDLEENKKKILDIALQKAKGLLIDAGYAELNIVTKMEVKQISVAQTIAAEAKNGYDIILMGRRGLSSVKEFFLGSVSQQVLHSVHDISVLIVN